MDGCFNEFIVYLLRKHKHFVPNSFCGNKSVFVDLQSAILFFS